MNIRLQNDSIGITDVPGFLASGIGCDIRGKGNDRLDLALIVADRPCAAAGVFTRNAVRAAPVRVCQEALAAGGPFRGIIANSGNANACTGDQGLADAREMIRLTADALGAEPSAFFVCSTGRIGQPLPMERIRPGIARGVAALAGSEAESRRAAEAILTSDTRAKTVTARFDFKGRTVSLSGIAKGAGMIQPDMATMLAFVVTDLQASSARLQEMLRQAVSTTFNAITVDGDMSTNDTVLLLANGASGVELQEGDSGELAAVFAEALRQVCDVLAEKIVSDGEKISKVVEVLVSGADTDQEAEKVARAIGNSLLVKSSWCGEDPNWGRLADAAGYSGARLIEERLDIHYDQVPAVLQGRPLPERKAEWKQVVQQRRFQVRINLNLGSGSFRLRASDLTEGYVTFNKSE
jgi:glutamate N-acetyltransferase / amino-acid N-acetyltransferase